MKRNAAASGPKGVGWLIAASIVGNLIGFVISRTVGWPSIEELGALGDFLGPTVAVLGIWIVMHQIRVSTKELNEDRVSDTLRLVTEWLETESAREQRQKLYSEWFIRRDVPAPGQPLHAFRIPKENEDNEVIQGAVEAVIAQFDRVGGYLYNVNGDLAVRESAEAAVLNIYALAIARAWLIVGPYMVGRLVSGRGRSYGRHAVEFAKRAIDRLEESGTHEIWLHPHGLPSKGLKATLDEARGPFRDLERRDAITADVRKAFAMAGGETTN